MAERRERGRDRGRRRYASSSSDSENDDRRREPENVFHRGIVTDSESDSDPSDGEISNSEFDYPYRDSSPESDDGHRDHQYARRNQHQHQQRPHHRHHHHRDERPQPHHHHDAPPMEFFPADDEWFDELEPTIEEVQSEEIRRLKRKLEDSRRETRQRDDDLEELKRAKRDDDYQMRKLKDTVYQKKQDLIELRYKYDKAEDSKKLLRENNDHLSDAVEQYFFSKEEEIKKRETAQDELKRTKKEVKSLKARIKAVEHREKYMETVEKERKRADNYRNMMLKMMQQINNDNREAGAEPVWKQCEICILEYDETADRTPRVLNCGHTICHGCAKQLLEDDEIRCPFDRTFTSLVSSYVSDLPKNYAVLQM